MADIVPYVCFNCGNPLKNQVNRLVCTKCGSYWDIVESIPCFAKGGPYWGEVPLDEMRGVLKSAREGYWKTALGKISSNKKEEILSNADETRGWWRYVLPGATEGKVLDIGAGLGAITFSFAGAGYQVVAVDSVFERASFLEIRRNQDEVNNVQIACASAIDLPFPESSFDIIIMNGVLEWLGLSDTSASPDKVQAKAINNAFRLLKPGGIFYIGIENRISIIYLLGFKDPHNGLRFTTLMPRKMANLYSKLRKKEEYRTYTYSKYGYKKILEKAGFRNINFFMPLPSYRHFKTMIPAGNKRVARYCVTHVWNMKRLRTLKIMLPLVRILPMGFLLDCFAPDYGIIAGKEMTG